MFLVDDLFLNKSVNFLFVIAEEPPTDMSPDSGINELAGLSLEEQERQKQEWASELAKVSQSF